MSRDTKPQLSTLAGICRRLNAARDRVAELEAQRDELIKQLRDAGVSGTTLAAYTGLSGGRVTQITQSNEGNGSG